MVGLLEVAATLSKAYAEAANAWWPVDASYHEAQGTDARFEIMVGAILTQNTSWTSVERSLQNLRTQRLLDPRRMARAPLAKVREAIRPSGFFNQKAGYLHALSARVSYKWQGDLGAFLAQDARALRAELLELSGIGPETADDILVYAARKPSFIIDEYTRRLMARLGNARGDEPYEALQRMWHEAIPREADRHGRVHASIVEHAKLRCTKNLPRCPGCPLEKVCRKVGIGPEVYLRGADEA